jgi:iron complex outermembrane receptor protein
VLGVRYTTAENAKLSQDDVTPQVGLLYRVAKPFSFYANYAETFEANYILDAFGKQVGPTTGKGYDIGFKTELLEDKLSATFAYYSVEHGNIPTRDFPREAELGITPLYTLGGLERSEGFEMDLIYAPTRNLQVIASFTDSEEHQTVTSSDPRQNGVALANVPQYVGNFWTKYTFVEGPLKRLSVGLGLKAVSSGAHLHPSFDVALYGDSYVTFQAMVGYQFKVGKKLRVDTRLNLENLTSEEYHPGVYSRSDPFNGYFTVRLSY